MAFAAACLFAAAGCSSTTAITPEARARLTQVQVQPIPGEISYDGMLPPEYEADQGNQFLGSPFTAPIGVIIEAFKYPSVQKRRAENFERALKQQGIDVPSIVGAKFAEQLEKCSIQPVAYDAEQEERDCPRLALTISYGFDSLAFLTEGWTPWLEIEGELIDVDGKILWRRSTSDVVNAELPFPDPFSDPGLLKRLFERSCNAQVRELMKDFNGKGK